MALFCEPAFAQNPIEPIRIAYHGAAGCPSTEMFTAQLRARTARVRFSNDDASSRQFHVSLSSTAASAAGTLTIVAQDGTRSERSVDGSSCDEVVAALALIAALAIDPKADTAPTHELVLPPPPPPDEPVKQKNVAPLLPPPRIIPPPAPVPRVQPRPGSRWRVGPGAQFSVTTGVAPSTFLSVPVFVDVARFEDREIHESLRLTFDTSATGDIDAEGGSASFRWLVGRIDGCIPVLRSGTEWVAAPCVFVEGGILRGQGANLPEPRIRTRPWFSVGAGLRGRWITFDSLFVEGQFMLRAALVRDRFLVEPDAPIYEVPAVGISGGLGIGSYL